MTWPELCTRGAISFTNTVPSVVMNSSTAMTPTASVTSATSSPTCRAFANTDSSSRAGTTTSLHMPSRWIVSSTG